MDAFYFSELEVALQKIRQEMLVKERTFFFSLEAAHLIEASPDGELIALPEADEPTIVKSQE